MPPKKHTCSPSRGPKDEYRAIVDAGFILQIDDPGLGETWDMMMPAPPLGGLTGRMQARNIEALNHAWLAFPKSACATTCVGAAGRGRMSNDLGLRDIVDLVVAGQGPGLLDRGGDASPCV